MDHEIVLPSNTRVVSEEEHKGVYEIDGLYPGYGHTLGNSVRRILLSSLPGAAVTKVKINGVSHEFSTIPGVMEDVITVMLNVKQLRFRLHGAGPETATIEVKGAREVKGKDVKCPSQLEVVNKDHHILTITDKSTAISAELTVERGIGFVQAEDLNKDKVEVGTLILDAIFSPVRRANYEVENMRVGDRTDYNRLRILLETDGTITPREAFEKALGIMRAQIEKAGSFEGEFSENTTPASSEEPSTEGLASLKISQRAKNALASAGINSPEMIASKSREDLLAVEGIGGKAVDEIEKALKKAGLSLRE